MRDVFKGCAMMVGALALVIVFFVAGFAARAYRGGAVVSYAAPPEGAASLAEPPGNFGLFAEALGLMRDQFYGEVPADAALDYAAIRGVLGRLSDRNTVLVEPVAHDREEEQFQGEFGGIGAQVSTNEAGQLVIIAPIDDTPAARAELQPNDIVLEVDGTAITGLTTDEAITLIRGEVGTQVTLLILRPVASAASAATPAADAPPLTEGETFSVTLTREKIPDPTVASSMVEGTDIGYIRLGFFSARSAEELREAIEELRAAGAKKFILDLRSNPGGLLETAIQSASLFIGDGTIAYQQFNDGRRETLEARGNPLSPDEPLLVLVNEGSASASEILAGALQSADRAQLLGTQSYGKGTVQIPYELSDGSSLHVTIAHWLTPDGVDLSNGGLTPDVIIETTDEQLQAGQDPVFDRAVEMLKEATQ